MLKHLKGKFEEAVRKNEEFRKTPHSSEEIRAHNKKAGWVTLFIGAFLALPNLYLIYYKELILVYLAVAAVFFIVAGIYVVITGKMPRP